MKNVLFIVYYFPPMGGSGVQRPLKFIKYLKEFGWNPIILCPEPGRYPYFDHSLQKELEELEPEIIRVEANTPFHIGRDTNQPLSFNLPEFLTKGLRRLSRLFMLPDNKRGWVEPALEEALKIIEERKIELIFSTAPPFSNHLIGKELKKSTGVPLVLDYRDAWLHNHFMDGLFRWQKNRMRSMEAACLREADGVITLDQYQEKTMIKEYGKGKKKWMIIPHGFDPEDFEADQDGILDYQNGKLNILYSGLFYEQNQPDHFIKGWVEAHNNGLADLRKVHFHFQGGLDERIRRLIRAYQLEEQVSDYGYVDHRTAVANLKQADLLWMISNFPEWHQQVKSSKLFEYMGSGKSILGLVHDGEEAQILKAYGAGIVGSLDSVETLAVQLGELFERWVNNSELTADPVFINTFDRRSLSSKLADFFDVISIQ